MNRAHIASFAEMLQRDAADLYPGRYSEAYAERLADMTDEAVNLLRQRRILLLAHNYQYPEIQEVARRAGYIGDSFGLTMKAKETEHDTIVFASVEFMAETAAILLPDRRILVPVRAGCSLVESVSLDAIRRWKEQHRDGKVISYINTDAKTKALSDYICTSRNAVKVVEYVRATHQGAKIFFLPDQYLAARVVQALGIPEEEIDIWNGSCHVHKQIGEFAIEEARDRYPDAELLVHPECGCTSSCLSRTVHGVNQAVPFLSTEGMIARAKESPAQEFIVATEIGMVYRLRREIPGKIFHPLSQKAECEHMKSVTLEKLLDCLKANDLSVYQVHIEPNVAAAAYKAIERMVAIC